jgi:hypothetical protein
MSRRWPQHLYLDIGNTPNASIEESKQKHLGGDLSPNSSALDLDSAVQLEIPSDNRNTSAEDRNHTIQRDSIRLRIK